MIELGMKHIRVFFMAEKESGYFDRATTNIKAASDYGKRGVNIASNAIGGVASIALDSEARDLAFKAKDAIEAAERSTDPIIRKTLELLKATGTIEMGVFNQARVIARFSDGSGKSGAQAILGAFEEAKKGVISIVLYSGGKYTPMNMSTYEDIVSKDASQINKGVSKGLWGLYQQGSSLGFKESTWSNISVYCARRNWKTDIIGGNPDIQKNIEELYNKRKDGEEKNLSILLSSLLPIIEKNDPRLAELLSKSNLERNPNGTINATKAIEKMNISSISQVPDEFRKIADTMKREANELFQKAREIAKSIPIKSLSDLKIEGIGKGVILNKPFDVFTEEEIKKYTPLVQLHIKGIKDPKQIEEIQKILTIFVSRTKGFERTRLAADAMIKEKSAEEVTKRNPNITKEQLGVSLNSEGEQQKAVLAQEVAASRTSSDHQLDILKEYRINTLEGAQRKLEELESKGELSREEQILKSELVGFIQAKIHEAQVLSTYGGHLTETDRQDIFTQTNRFISDNPNEQYNFQSLDKVSVLTDPEASIGARNLARMEPGETMSMVAFVTGELRSPVSTAPEISSISVSMNASGGYDIPTLQATNLSREQVREYMSSVTLYADMGLSQLIPHLKMITGELRNKGVNTALDGSSNTMEQQQVLKALYSQFFGKDIISSSLGDVERAFSSALGNPTNMKSAMQGVLERHLLISESGQPIAPDTLQTWIRNNKSDNEKPTINLT